MRQELYIRADANHVLGIGHVMRCSSIAEEWIGRGGECVFLVADEESAQIVQQCGFPSICLHSSWNDLTSEIDTLSGYIRERGIAKILIDSYYVSPAYLSAVRSLAKVVYMGNMRPVDMIINYSITADSRWFRRVYGEDVIQLLGCRFFPLRQEFREVHTVVRDTVKDVLITTGGGDSCHMALQLSRLLLQHTDLQVHVVVGAFNPDKELLNHLQEEHSQLHLYQNVANMAELMEKCDLAISAGGSTLYELCACQVPTVTYAFADNQLAGIEGFKKQGIMESIGDVREQDANTWQSSLLAILHEICRNHGLRKKMAERMQQLIDGQGCRRIVDAILQDL